MNRPAVQLGLFRQLIEKHPESYRLHLLDLMQRRATNLCDLKGEMWDLEREYRQWWAPEIERRRGEVEALRQKVRVLQGASGGRPRLEPGYLETDLEGHRKALANATAEIRDLRASWSWRLTAPVRALTRWIRPGGAG